MYAAESATAVFRIVFQCSHHDVGNLFALQGVGARLQGQASAIREGDFCGGGCMVGIMEVDVPCRNQNLARMLHLEMQEDRV